ncbi:stage II sporulation protein M [Jeotgalicoccus halotolerans]|uniref:stage II sporulation protein M n=1 Tax=Jeotgalicoccus halotolerans TaxID=157227 RepID=UPI0035185BC2
MNKILKRACKFLIMSVIITIAAAGVTYIINLDIHGIMSNLNDRTPESIKDEAGLNKVWEYIVNNGMMVPMQMFILSLIPIQFLYLINIIVTVTLPGILFGMIFQFDLGKGMSMMVSSIPHYLFEVFAFCIFAAVLFELNKSLRLKIKTVLKKEEQKLFIGSTVITTVKTYILLVLPLIITAALLETYIADVIYKILQ